MAFTRVDVLDKIRTIETDYKDCRAATEREMRVLVWFYTYLFNILSEKGRLLKGHSFRQKETTCLLVVKTELDGIPQVVFVTARTPMDCMVSFCKKFYGGTLEWVTDKYP